MLSVACLDITDARLLVAGLAATEAIGVPVRVAITGESGHLIAFECMDDGKVTHTTIAIDKAYTAAAPRRRLSSVLGVIRRC